MSSSFLSSPQSQISNSQRNLCYHQAEAKVKSPIKPSQKQFHCAVKKLISYNFSAIFSFFMIYTDSTVTARYKSCETFSTY
jgi:hypothetical protein